ncbi:hypothetical protein KY284_012941 [Solanum tuberosum]|nr:hypothetical protein KY284_012941 [Solanum tuberosum]
MVVEVNYKLRNLWIDIKRNHEREIHQLLGGLTYLIFVIPNLQLIRVLLEFWDPVRMVFKFVDFDLVPTIKEISGFIDLPYHECDMMIHFNFLYSRFVQDDSYHSFSDEFDCSVERWEIYRLNVFAIALLGSQIFPKIRGRINTRLGYVVRDLAQREGEPRKTLVPIILAEIMRILSACVDGRMFFEGCNILLQLWAIERFYIRSDAIDIFLGYDNKIDNHPRRMVAFTAPINHKSIIYFDDGSGCWPFLWVHDMPYAHTMIYHTRSNDALPSLPNENHKGKRKATNEKVMSKTIEKKHLSDELVSKTNIDKPPVTSQATLQDNPPPTHPTSQNQPSSIQMPPKNTHFPNYPYPPQHHVYAPRPPYLTPLLQSPAIQDPPYQTLLHQVPWYCAPLIPFQISPYQMHPSQKPPLPYQNPTYPVHNVKTLTQKHNRKNLFNVEKRPIKIYAHLTKPIDQFYEKLRLAGHIAPISEIRMNTRVRWIEPSKVCALITQGSKDIL